MGNLETKIVVAVGAELIRQLFAPERNSQLTAKIVAAKTKEEVRKAVNEELVEIISESVPLPEETEELVGELVNAQNQEDIEAIIEQPSVLTLIIEGIGRLLQSIGSLLFGK